MNKATVQSPANIAFVKYWGRSNDKLILPLNNSISMNLSSCYTTTTIEFGDFAKDEVKIDFQTGKFEPLSGKQLDKVINQVNRIRNEHNISLKAKIYSKNNFPTGVGIASSASGFSALTKAIFEALEIHIDEKELTIQTRLSGSGSACRSIPDGYVEWYKGKNSKTSYAASIASESSWNLTDFVVVVDQSHKQVGSYEGHLSGKDNEYMKARLTHIDKRLEQTRTAIKNRDLEMLGEVLEHDAMSLHAVAMLASQPIYYLNGSSFEVIHAVLEMRNQGLEAYFTIDAGPNIHVMCESKKAKKVERKLKQIPGVDMIISNKPTIGAHPVNKHLF